MDNHLIPEDNFIHIPDIGCECNPQVCVSEGSEQYIHNVKDEPIYKPRKMKIIEREKLSTIDVKLRYLAKIVWVYRRFSKHFGSVNVIFDRGEVTVTWYDPNESFETIHDFEAVSFPITRLDSRIDTYKARLEFAFKHRNDPTVDVKFKR